LTPSLRGLGGLTCLIPQTGQLEMITQSSPSRSKRTSRRGAAISLMLPLFLVGLLTLALAVDAGALYHVRMKMRTGTDAAALAAALALVDDRGLIDSALARAQLLEDARAEGIRYAVANGVSGLTDNALSGPGPVDVVFDDGQDGEAGIPAGTIPNVVRVRGFRTNARTVGVPLLMPQLFGLGYVDAVVRSRALVDRRVLGFRPLPGRSIPLVPVAILSDPKGTNRQSWEYQISAEPHDNVAFVSGQRQFVADAGDGLPEIVLTFPGSAVALVFTQTDDLPRQVVEGLGARDLESLGGSLVPSRSSSPVKAIGPPELRSMGARLAGAIEEVQSRGEPRVWPLFEVPGATGGSIRISGFVAARIVRLDRTSPMRLWLQPAAVATSTALSRRDVPANPKAPGEPVPINPYIAKVRLIE
jgi:hypothetical protein